MAFLEMKIFSDALGHGVSVNVILPQRGEVPVNVDENGEATYKTLWLLHGLSDDHTAWARYTSIERYADERGIAVVMPYGGRSWYTDAEYGEKYFTFITDELPRICRQMFRGMSAKREDNMIAGLSMGGYGAMKAALTYPERYMGCTALSGAFDIAYMAEHLVPAEAKHIFGEMASPEELYGTCHDVFHLARVAVAEGRELPTMYVWCGEDDFIFDSSKKMHAVLEELGVEHIYETSEGNHSWFFWDKFIQMGLHYMLG